MYRPTLPAVAVYVLGLCTDVHGRNDLVTSITIVYAVRQRAVFSLTKVELVGEAKCFLALICDMTI